MFAIYESKVGNKEHEFLQRLTYEPVFLLKYTKCLKVTMQ